MGHHLEIDSFPSSRQAIRRHILEAAAPALTIDIRDQARRGARSRIDGIWPFDFKGIGEGD